MVNGTEHRECEFRYDKSPEAEETLRAWKYLAKEFDPPLRCYVKDVDSYLRKISFGAYSVIAMHAASGAVVGCVSFYANDEISKHAYITSIAVKSGYTGRGIARVLLGLSMDMSRDRGMRSIGLRVNSGNARAVSLYSKAGFACIGAQDEWMEMRCNL